MLTITHTTDVPDSTYFRTGDVEPTLTENSLIVLNGSGTRRGWGTPGVTSTPILETETLISIHIGFHHKHGGGQYWRHYQRIGEQWEQVSWVKLSDPDRHRILIAYEDRAPDWAKVPGKLRDEYAKPSGPVLTTYKIVRVIDDRFYSVYKPEGRDSTEYVLGKRLMERVVVNHGGGYYSYPHAEGVEALFREGRLFPRRFDTSTITVALLECEISGRMVRYSRSGHTISPDEQGETVDEAFKIASTYIRPIRVVKILDPLQLHEEVH